MSADTAADEPPPYHLFLDAREAPVAASALRLLLNDLQREQADEREILREILEKLPDEHTMRAIQL